MTQEQQKKYKNIRELKAKSNELYCKKNRLVYKNNLELLIGNLGKYSREKLC